MFGFIFWIILFSIGIALAITLTLGPEKLRSSAILGTSIVILIEISRIMIIFSDPSPFFIPNFLNLLIGIPIFLTGIILEIFAEIKIKLYGFSGTANNESLYTDGIYGKVRHPIYLGEIIWPVGLVIIVGGVYSLFIAIIWTIFFIILAKLEERNLIQIHGDKYKEYQHQVPMIFPLRFRRKRQKSNKK